MKRFHILGAAVFMVLAAGGVLFLPLFRVLVLEESGTADVRLCARVGESEELALSFIHSVNKRPVRDTLKVEGDHLVIVGSRYDMFGAGMPESTTQDGTFEVLPDGGLLWTVNRPVPEVVVRVGRVANHTLHIKGRDIPLADLTAPGKALAFRVRRVALFEMVKAGCLW
jgi:hypothetical protein